MKNTIKNTAVSLSLLLGASIALPAFAGMPDDPVVTKLMLDQFEVGGGNGENPIAWEGGFWIGKDLNKLWFKTEGERVSGETEETESQLLLSHAVSAFWDLQVGWRHDTVPGESRDYATIGIQGLAPYYFETDASLSFGENDQIKLNAAFEYEMMLTQKLILSPEVEINAYSKDDLEMGVRSGFSDIEAGLRLRYEIRREFAPYIGVNWTKQLGNTADLARDEGEDTSETLLVLGIRAWF